MSSPSPRSRRFFSFVGCLVAGPLGCLSFLGGGCAVIVFFTPELFEKLVHDELIAHFEEDLVGELSIEEIDLAWTSTQHLNGVELRDGDGRVVLRGSLDFPPLLALWPGSESLGVSTLRLEGDIHVNESGEDNLTRALASKRAAKASGKTEVEYNRNTSLNVQELLEFAFDSNGQVVVEVRRFSWAVAGGTAQSGVIARELRGTIDLKRGEPLAVKLNGRLGKLNSPSESGSLVVSGHIEREAFFAPRTEGRPGIRGALIAKQLPTELLDLVSVAGESVRGSLGESFGLQLSLDPAESNRSKFLALLDSEGLSGRATGIVTSNGLLPINNLTPNREHIELDLELDSFPQSVVNELLASLPFDELSEGEFRVDSSSAQPLKLSIKDLEWTRRRREHTIGMLELELPDSSVLLADERVIRIYQPTLRFGLGKGENRRAGLSGALAEDGRGEFLINYQAEQGERGEEGEATLALTHELEVECRTVPVAVLDESLRLEGQLSSALGSSADLNLSLAMADGDSGPFIVELLSDRADIEFRGTVLGTPDGVDEWLAALDFTGEVTGGGSQLLAPFMPDSVRLDWDEALDIAYEGWRTRVRVEGDVVVGDSTSADYFGVGESGPLEGGSLTLSVPALVYRDADPNSEIFELEMTELDFFARGDSEVLRVDVSANLAGGGRVAKIWTFYGLSGPFGRDGHQDLRLQATSTGMPTLALDQRIGTDGLFQDLFGSEVALDLTGGGLSATGGRVQCDIQSERATARVEGFREGGGGLTDAIVTLDFELDTLSTSRLSVPLLPFVTTFEPASEGARRARLSLAGGYLPLDGDLERLGGRLSLDLGAVRPVFTELFESFLAEPVAPAEGEAAQPLPASDLAPIEFQLADGQLECLAFILPVRGHASEFVGQLGLGGTDLDLQVEFPLVIVGEKANVLLHSMRDSFQPDLTVPIEISGATIDELDMSVRPQWVRTVNDILGQFVIPSSLTETVRGILGDDGESEAPAVDDAADAETDGD